MIIGDFNYFSRLLFLRVIWIILITYPCLLAPKTNSLSPVIAHSGASFTVLFLFKKKKKKKVVFVLQLLHYNMSENVSARPKHCSFGALPAPSLRTEVLFKRARSRQEHWGRFVPAPAAGRQLLAAGSWCGQAPAWTRAGLKLPASPWRGLGSMAWTVILDEAWAGMSKQGIN